MEVWKPIVGWEGYYEVSNLGQVKSLCHKNHIIRKLRRDKDGYMLVTIKVRPREATIKVHREVLRAFVGGCPEGHQVNHKNGQREDNRLENLEYVTFKANTQHAWETIRSPQVSSFAKITPEIARQIRAEYLATRKLTATAEKFGMSRNAVWLIGTGKTWRHV